MNSSPLFYIHYFLPGSIWISQEQTPEESPGPSLVFDRRTGSISLAGNSPDAKIPGLKTLLLHFVAGAPRIPVAGQAGRKIHGVLGFLRLPPSASGAPPVCALVIATAREKAGTLRGHSLWRVADTEVLPLQPPPPSATQAVLQPLAALLPDSAALLLPDALTAPGEHPMLALLREALGGAELYYCHGADVTASCQAAARSGVAPPRRDGGGSPPAAPLVCEPRFLWTAHLAEPLHAAGAGRFTLACISGFAASVSFGAGPAAGLQLLLLARRDCARPGPRLWARGLGLDGAAAGFVESEQILDSGADTPAASRVEAAFLQVRGSVPVLWQQPPCLAPKPVIALAPPPASAPALAAHLAWLRRYGSVLCLDLLRQTGRERALGDAFRAAWGSAGLSPIPDLSAASYLGFDFNAETQRGAALGMARLFGRLQPAFQHHSWWLAPGVAGGAEGGRSPAPRGSRSEGAPQRGREQCGVVRTNCLDCLDRTNLAQSMVARRALEQQLAALGRLPSGAALSDAPDVAAAATALWEAHGDALSRHYSGTPALRRARGVRGALRDAAVSAWRHVLNNHRDGRKADATALALGLHAPLEALLAEQFGVAAGVKPGDGGLAAWLHAARGAALHRLRRFPALQCAALVCAAQAVRTAFCLLSRGRTKSLAAATALAAAALLWAALCVATVRQAEHFGVHLVDRPALYISLLADDEVMDAAGNNQKKMTNKKRCEGGAGGC